MNLKHEDIVIGSVVLYYRGPQILGSLIRGEEYNVSEIKFGLDSKGRETKYLSFKETGVQTRYDIRWFSLFLPSFGQKVTARLCIEIQYNI